MKYLPVFSEPPRKWTEVRKLYLIAKNTPNGAEVGFEMLTIVEKLLAMPESNDLFPKTSHLTLILYDRRQCSGDYVDSVSITPIKTTDWGCEGEFGPEKVSFFSTSPQEAFENFVILIHRLLMTSVSKARERTAAFNIISMKPCTEKIFRQLWETVWFSNVGITPKYYPNISFSEKQVSVPPIELVPSWEKAIKMSQLRKWKELLLEAANQNIIIRGTIFQWDEIVSEMKENIVPLVVEKTREVVTQQSLPNDFEQSVQWHIEHWFYESECSDIVNPGFFHVLVYWYLQGHFPCGWKGNYPEGELIIF